MRTWRRRLRAALTAGRTVTSSSGTLTAFWRDQRRALAHAVLLVRVLYVCLFFIQLQLYANWNGWLKLESLKLLWPVAWFRWTGVPAGVAVVVFGSLLCSLLAAAAPTSRIARGLAALFILQFAAFFNSFGSTNHGWHAWTWTAVVLVFLPDGALDSVSDCTSRAQRYLRVVWFAQALNLLFYSMSGGFKLAGAAAQFARGEVHALAPDALARHIAYRVMEGTRPADYTFGPFIVAHPYAGWPIYLLGLYIEVFSVLVAFRPSLHRAWGVILICFHLGIHFTLTIMFSWQTLLVGLLFLASPFAPARGSLAVAVRSLPLFGAAWTWRRRRPAPAAARRHVQPPVHA